MGSPLALDEVQMRMAGLETTFDELNLGMTQERQRETQQALFNMLSGGGGTGSTEPSSSSSSSSSSSPSPPSSSSSGSGSSWRVEEGPEWACEILP